MAGFPFIKQPKRGISAREPVVRVFVYTYISFSTGRQDPRQIKLDDRGNNGRNQERDSKYCAQIGHAR